MRAILHISDVHFGPPHRSEVSQGVLQLIAERRPDLVVVSGDLTQRAKPVQFRQARRFVESLGAPTIVVPGNHDVPLYRFWERLFAPFAAYRAHFNAELEPMYESDGLVVIGVNTAYNWTFTGGRLTRRQLERVERLLAPAPSSALKVVVAHHQLVPPPAPEARGVLANAARALRVFSRAGVDLVLSGHLHQSYVAACQGVSPAGRMLVVHTGTTTSSRGRGVELQQNTCNWLSIGERTVQISTLRWQAGASRFIEQSRHLYPRQISEELASTGAGVGLEPVGRARELATVESSTKEPGA
jgi:3',5'-cyclic AMP phosphodiesterase CpdA